MLQFPIVHDPGLLRQRSIEVSDFSDGNRENLEEIMGKMRCALKESDSWGIAALQVGELLRIIALRSMVNDHDPIFYFNPKIISWKGITLRYEGCVSIPEKSALVLRRTFIELHYQDQFGHEKQGNYHTRDAQVMQHEIDHLDGKLITSGFRKLFSVDLSYWRQCTDYVKRTAQGFGQHL